MFNRHRAPRLNMISTAWPKSLARWQHVENFLDNTSFHFSAHTHWKRWTWCWFFFLNHIAWWKVTEKWMLLWNNSMHHFLSFDGFDSLHWRLNNSPQNGLLCMITLRQTRRCDIREVRKSKYQKQKLLCIRLQMSQ